jgi:hypothetical protein
LSNPLYRSYDSECRNEADDVEGREADGGDLVDRPSGQRHEHDQGEKRQRVHVADAIGSLRIAGFAVLSLQQGLITLAGVADRLPWWGQIVLGALLTLAGIEGVAGDDQLWAKLLFLIVIASGVFNIANGVRRRGD